MSGTLNSYVGTTLSWSVSVMISAVEDSVVRMEWCIVPMFTAALKVAMLTGIESYRWKE